jgi:hypothetical protein
MKTQTHTHPRYLGRTVEWGHWGITFMDKQPDPMMNFGVIVATIPFGVGARGPVDGTAGSDLRKAYEAMCHNWVDNGILPAGCMLSMDLAAQAALDNV